MHQYLGSVGGGRGHLLNNIFLKNLSLAVLKIIKMTHY